MFTKSVRVLYAGLAWLWVVGLLAQVFLVGLALFDKRSYWEAHMGLGHLIGLLPLLFVLLSFLGRFTRRDKGLAALVFGVYFVQVDVFAGIRSTAPGWIVAFHPVLAFALLALSLALAQRARGTLRGAAVAAPASLVALGAVGQGVS